MENKIEQIYGDLNQKLGELKNFYKKARIKILAVKINEKVFLYFGSILFLDEDIKLNQDLFYNYAFNGINSKPAKTQINSLYFIQKDEILENTMKLVGNIFENRKINLKQPDFNICEIDFQPPSEIRTYHRSNFPYVLFAFKWPTYRYNLNIKSDNSQVKNGLISQGNLFSIDAPLYPNIMRGFEHFFSLKRKLEYRLPEPALSIILPDYRGRIEKVTVNDNNLSVQVEHKFPTNDDLSVKYYYTTETGHNYSEENYLLDENSRLLIYTTGYPFGFECCSVQRRNP